MTDKRPFILSKHWKESFHPSQEQRVAALDEAITGYIAAGWVFISRVGVCAELVSPHGPERLFLEVMPDGRLNTQSGFVARDVANTVSSAFAPTSEQPQVPYVQPVSAPVANWCPVRPDTGSESIGGIALGIGIVTFILAWIPLLGIVIGLIGGLVTVVLGGIGLGSRQRTGAGVALFLGILTLILKVIPGINLL